MTTRTYPYPVNEFASPAEELIYWKLREKLGEDYTVLYGCRWKNKKVGSNPDPECDFIITKLDGGILDLEVKGGRWEKRGGTWYANGKSVPEKDNPFTQGRQNKYDLLNLLKGNTRWQNTWFPIDYVVATPDTPSIQHTENSEVEMLAQGDLDYIQEWVESAMQSCQQRNFPHKCSDQMIEYVIETLLNDYVFKLNDILLTDDRRLLVFTQQQLEYYHNLDKQRKLTIQGCAGSGKTLLAIQQVKRLAKQSDVKSILFTCFNLELGEWLKSNTKDISDKCTTAPIQEYFKQEAQKAGRLTGTEKEDARFFDELPGIFLDVLSKTDLKYDAIVVDEGQSFKNDWWALLEMMLKDKEKGYFYIFFDHLQRIYRETENRVPGEEQPIPLNYNLRNTARIHQYATKYLPKDLLPKCNNIEGEPLWISFYDDEKSMKKLLRRYLQKLIIKEGISAKDIIILTPKGIEKTALKVDEQLGGFRLTSVEKNEPERIRFTSIPKFRGMERQVVILVEFDESVREMESNFYLGASRAKTKLVILASNKLSDSVKASLRDGCEEFLGSEKSSKKVT